MSKSRRHTLRTISNTGFASSTNEQGTERLTNRDGSPNLKKTGIPFYERISVYHSLLRMSRAKFLLLVFLFYTTINFVFALVYFLIGVDSLAGTEKAVTQYDKFLEAFFFSAQTLTTVGYGHTAPTTHLSSAVSSFESLIGILVFALVTGLFYGRFSRPRAFILFSNVMLIAPYEGGRALMIRIATYKNNHLTDVEATLTAAVQEGEGGKRKTEFYPLAMEISKINSLALSWTIVHPIDANSPLFNSTEEEIRDKKLELIVGIKAFDDHFSNTVQQRTSYTISSLVYGGKFKPMFERSPNGTHTIMRLDDIDDHKQVELPVDDAESFTDAATVIANN